MPSLKLIRGNSYTNTVAKKTYNRNVVYQVTDKEFTQLVGTGRFQQVIPATQKGETSGTQQVKPSEGLTRKPTVLAAAEKIQVPTFRSKQDLKDFALETHGVELTKENMQDLREELQLALAAKAEGSSPEKAIENDPEKSVAVKV